MNTFTIINKNNYKLSSSLPFNNISQFIIISEVINTGFQFVSTFVETPIKRTICGLPNGLLDKPHLISLKH